MDISRKTLGRLDTCHHRGRDKILTTTHKLAKTRILSSICPYRVGVVGYSCASIIPIEKMNRKIVNLNWNLRPLPVSLSFESDWF